MKELCSIFDKEKQYIEKQVTRNIHKFKTVGNISELIFRNCFSPKSEPLSRKTKFK
jgi:hypothetical protein